MSDPDKIRGAAYLDEQHATLENLVVLYLTQAMLGLVSDNLRAVAAEVRPDRLIVHFAFAEERSEDREDVEDILADLDAFLDNTDVPESWTIVPAVHVGKVDEDWPGLMFRRIFETKASRLAD